MDQDPRRDPKIIYTGAAQSRPAAPDPAALQQLFENLEILEVLGRGGMGVVYKARQTKLDRFVALKILAPELVSDPSFEQRFLREARALAQLNHPNIVSIFDFGDVGGLYFLLMEYVDGTGLRDVLRAGSLSPEQALAIVPQICDALQFAHEHGVVHRDIKPENILLDRHGRVKIADFGLAKMASKGGSWTLTVAGQSMGTPHYMAPEQINTPLEVDHRADIYSLGVVLYEMLTRELPIGRFDPPSAKVHVDVRLDQIVLRALEREPARRYQHASEVKTDVQQASAADPSPASAGPAPARSIAADQPRSLSVAWIDQLPLHPMWLGWLATAAGMALTYVIYKQSLHRQGDSMAIVYPLGFLSLVAMRSTRIGTTTDDRTGSILLRIVAFGLLMMTIAVLGEGRFLLNKQWVVPGVAAGLMIFAHLLAERWVRLLRWDSLGGACLLWLLGAIVYSGTIRGGNGTVAAFNYFTGIAALQFGSTALVCVPSFFMVEGSSRSSTAVLLRSLGVGLVLATIYFRKDFH